MIDMCPLELEKHLVLNAGIYETYLEAKSAIRGRGEQMFRKSNTMGFNGMAHPVNC